MENATLLSSERGRGGAGMDGRGEGLRRGPRAALAHHGHGRSLHQPAPRSAAEMLRSTAQLLVSVMGFCQGLHLTDKKILSNEKMWKLC